MAIDDLRRRIFQKDENFVKRYQEPRLGKHKDQAPVSWQHEDQNNSEISPEISKEKKNTRKILLWGLSGGFVVMFGLVLFFLLPGGLQFGNDSLKHITVRVEGGEQISAGNKVVWKVIYKNDNQTALQDATLTFEFPETAQPLVGEFSQEGLKREKRNLGKLAPGTQGEELFSAIVFGAKDSTLSGKASFEYRPQDSSARFVKETKYETHVIASLLGVAFEAPQNLQAGQQADVKLHVTSSADTAFKDLTVQVTYPEGFEFVSADPVPSRANNIWHIGDLNSNAEYVITLHGKINQANGAQSLRADVGLYDRNENKLAALFTSVSQSFSIADSLLSLNFTTDAGETSPGVVQAGKTLGVSLHWANNLPVAVHNVNIEVHVDGSVLDLKTLQSPNGEAQVNSNTLKWLAARIPALSVVDPGESGTFNFKVATVKDIPQTTDSDKNFTIKIAGTISSPEGAVGYEGVDISGHANNEYKVASRVLFTQKAYYYDSRIQNAGPIPPHVGQETTYTIVWSLLNTVNDINGVVVRATIPSYLRWTGQIVPADTSLSFNASTRELVWQPGTIAAGTGFVKPAREISFQVGLTPSIPQVGKSPELISASTMEAMDSFTNTPFKQDARSVNTGLPDDPKVAHQGNVKQ